MHRKIGCSYKINKNLKQGTLIITHSAIGVQFINKKELAKTSSPSIPLGSMNLTQINVRGDVLTPLLYQKNNKFKNLSK